MRFCVGDGVAGGIRGFWALFDVFFSPPYQLEGLTGTKGRLMVYNIRWERSAFNKQLSQLPFVPDTVDKIKYQYLAYVKTRDNLTRSPYVGETSKDGRIVRLVGDSDGIVVGRFLRCSGEIVVGSIHPSAVR